MLTDFLYVDKAVSTIVYSNGTKETTADKITEEFKKFKGNVLDFGNMYVNKEEVFTIKSAGFGVGNRVTVYFKNGKTVSFIPASAPAVIFNILGKYKKIDAPAEVVVVDAPVKEVEAIEVEEKGNVDLLIEKNNELLESMGMKSEAEPESVPEEIPEYEPVSEIAPEVEPVSEVEPELSPEVLPETTAPVTEPEQKQKKRRNRR